MSKTPAGAAARMIDDLVAVGRRLSADAQAGRPEDQPSGDGARLSAVHWCLSPVGGVEVQNLEELFTGGSCAQCLVPLGTRTRRHMSVRYSGASSRRYDGVLAQLPERPKGPTFSLFSERFLSLLTSEERRRFRWRAVDVGNPTKTSPPLFEIVHSVTHLEVVALRGGNPDRERCEECERCSPPSYPLVGCLPTWLNPGGELVRRDQPSQYVAAHRLPDPAPAWFTVGEWTRGASLVVSGARVWSRPRPPGTAGINVWPLGAVEPALMESDS